MNQTLKNQCALVTGGSRGIGAAIVKRLAAEGANVALTYSNSPERAHAVVQAAQAFGVHALAIQADSADAEAVIAAVERTTSTLGGLDILVNNAASWPWARWRTSNWRTLIARWPSTCGLCSSPPRRQSAT